MIALFEIILRLITGLIFLKVSKVSPLNIIKNINSKTVLIAIIIWGVNFLKIVDLIYYYQGALQSQDCILAFLISGFVVDAYFLLKFSKKLFNRTYNKQTGHPR